MLDMPQKDKKSLLGYIFYKFQIKKLKKICKLTYAKNEFYRQIQEK